MVASGQQRMPLRQEDQRFTVQASLHGIKTRWRSKTETFLFFDFLIFWFFDFLIVRSCPSSLSFNEYIYNYIYIYIFAELDYLVEDIYCYSEFHVYIYIVLCLKASLCLCAKK